MPILRRWILCALVFAVAAGACFGQDAEAIKFYKLEFVVKEVQGAKVLNSRAYSTIVSTGNAHNAIRAGSRIPFATSKPTPGQPFATTQYQQVDVGVNIDTSAVKEVENRLSLTVGVEVSSMAEDSATPLAPVIRQNKWTSTVVVSFRKPTVVFSSDDVTAKSQMQLEVTATPL
jgi:hypothetical protein